MNPPQSHLPPDRHSPFGRRALDYARNASPAVGRPRNSAALFYDTLDEIGQFTEVEASDMPPVYQHLLAHEEHMTVTVEQYYGDRVDVEVVAKRHDPPHYSRKILLRRREDHVLWCSTASYVSIWACSPNRCAMKFSASVGRWGTVLIRHDVLRRVRLLNLWRVEAGPDLQRLFELDGPQTTFGRTAVIDCNEEPAIELIEIVREGLGHG